MLSSTTAYERAVARADREKEPVEMALGPLKRGSYVGRIRPRVKIGIAALPPLEVSWSHKGIRNRILNLLDHYPKCLIELTCPETIQAEVWRRVEQEVTNVTRDCHTSTRCKFVLWPVPFSTRKDAQRFQKILDIVGAAVDDYLDERYPTRSGDRGGFSMISLLQSPNAWVYLGLGGGALTMGSVAFVKGYMKMWKAVNDVRAAVRETDNAAQGLKGIVAEHSTTLDRTGQVLTQAESTARDTQEDLERRSKEWSHYAQKMEAAAAGVSNLAAPVVQGSPEMIIADAQRKKRIFQEKIRNLQDSGKQELINAFQRNLAQQQAIIDKLK